MSWRDNKKRGGYSRGRGYRQNRGGGNAHLGSSETTEDGEGGQKQYSGYRGGGGYRGGPRKRNQANRAFDGKRTKYEVGERLKEEDIGATEFVGSHKRFAGLVKERFGDFHVHEISRDGEICKLTNQDIPRDPRDLEDTERAKESVPSDARDKLEAFANGASDQSPVEIDVTDMDKETRRTIHAIAKKIPSVVSETVERDGKKMIVLTRRNERSGREFRADRREDWSGREGNYCHFLLHKVNMDTMDALNQLAVKLRLKPDVFHYAGTKDRRARTTQWVSLKKVNPTKIRVAAKQVRGALVGNFKFAKEPLRLGSLNGNRFGIALRSVDASDEVIERAVNSLRDNGFVNYYGLQRFGSVAAIPTHDIGRALLRGEWKEAIDLILKPRVGEQRSDMAEAREIYRKTGDAASALRPVARSGKIEAKLLEGIVTSGAENPQGALDRIPRNARLMYIHSYQSLVWNNMVSRRIREFGSKPIVGDLVCENGDSEDLAEFEIADRVAPNDDESERRSDEAEKRVETENSERSEIEESSDAAEREKPDVAVTSVTVEEIRDRSGAESETDPTNLPAVKALTEEDLPNYTLADVVMPKPGWKVTYPAYAKPWYDEFLAKDDLTTDLRQKNMKYSLGGAYRKILEKPGDLSWKIVRYNGYHDDLILCDADEMRGVELPKQDSEGKYKGVILEFSLSPSTYATMALREILEHDTSAQSQAAQSAANQERERKEEAASGMEIDGRSADGEVESVITKSESANDASSDVPATEAELTARSGDSCTEKEGDEDKTEVAEDGADLRTILDAPKTRAESTENCDTTDGAVDDP